MFCSFSLARCRLLVLELVNLIPRFASPKKTNQKKGAFFLGIFALSGKTATSLLNFLQGFENF